MSGSPLGAGMDRNTELHSQARQVLPGGNTRTTVFVPPAAPYASRGSGARLIDENGHETIDCNNNYTSLIHGHRFAPVMQAVQSALEAGTAFGLPTRSEIALAEELGRRLPNLDRWRFCNSGTEAVMQAIRIARAATGKDLIIRFAGSYHGTSDAVVDPSAPGIPASISESVTTVPVGDEAAFERAVDLSGSRLAAVLVDLMPNRAGLTPVSQAFASMLRERTQDVGALLIIDEVITFRLDHGGLQTVLGVQPDLCTLGKAIGGGFPVGAVGGAEEIMAVTDPTRTGAVAWGGTFSANPVTMHAGLAALHHYPPEVISDLNEKGDRLRAALSAAGIACSGMGSLARVFPQDMTTAWWSAYRAGVLLGSNGLIALSTAMSDEDVQEIADRLLDAIEPTERQR